jgi:hypothetical protein
LANCDWCAAFAKQPREPQSSHRSPLVATPGASNRQARQTQTPNPMQRKHLHQQTGSILSEPA